MEQITLPPDTALLVVDMQKAFEDPSLPPRNNPDAEANAARLLAAWRGEGRPLFHVRDDGGPGSRFAPDQPGNAFLDVVAPLPGEAVVPKQANSAFIGTDLEARLRGAGITTLVIVGFTVNHCVETTTRMAGNLGFDTYLVGDATAAWDMTGPDGRTHRAADIHSVSLANLHGEFATVTDTDAVLAALPEGRGEERGVGRA